MKPVIKIRIYKKSERHKENLKTKNKDYAVLRMQQEVVKTPYTKEVEVYFMSSGKGRQSSHYDIQM